VLDTILKITEEIPKQTPENYEIQLHSSTGFLIRLWQRDLPTPTNGKMNGIPN